MKHSSALLLIWAAVLIGSSAGAQVRHNVAGRLYLTTTQGPLPAAYVPVELSSSQTTWRSGVQYTDHDGWYFFRGVPSGPFLLAIWPGETRQIKCSISVLEQLATTSLPPITIPQCPQTQSRPGLRSTASVVVIVNKHSGLALDVPNASPDDHVLIQQFPLNNGANQAWTIGKVGTAYTIQSRATGKCLDIPNASTDAGIRVQQFGCHGGLNQQWTFIPAGGGYYYIRGVHSGLYLAIPSSSTAPHALLQQDRPNGGDNQKWALLQDGRPSVVP